MEYTTPTLQPVGTAQSLVLGLGPSTMTDGTSSGVLEVLGLDD
jgi:hypothetical protein